MTQLESEPKNIEISKMITISTAHVSEDMFMNLLLNDSYNTELMVYGKTSVDNTNYGLFIYINPDIYKEKLPEELIPLIDFTLDNGCNILCLDSDGQEIETLPKFDW